MSKDIFKDEKMISASKGIRAEIHDKTRKEIEITNQKNPNVKPNKTHNKLRKGRALATAFVLSISGWIGVGQVKDYKYQKDIDKHNDGTIMLVPPENFKFDKDEQREATEYLTAAFSYSRDDITESEKEKYADTIDEYVRTGKAIELEKNVMTRQLDIAKKIGDSKSIDGYDRQQTKLTFYNEPGEAKGFRISGVDGEYYQIEGVRIFENDVPKNLINSARDYYKYSDTNWGNMNRNERIEVGIQIAENTETLMNDHYVITKNGIERVNNKDFKQLAEEYNDKEKKKSAETRQKVYDEYGYVGKEEVAQLRADDSRDL